MTTIRVLFLVFLTFPAVAAAAGEAPADCPGAPADGSQLAVYLGCPDAAETAGGDCVSRLGLNVKEAWVVADESAYPSIFLELDPASACRLHQLTAAHVGETLAVAFEGRILIAPKIMEPIPNGQLHITPGIGKTIKDAAVLCRKIDARCRFEEGWGDRFFRMIRRWFG